MKAIAEALYDMIKDMDYMDYSEHEEKEIENITNELQVLADNNCDYLLNIIQQMVEQ